nr:OmpH family outer membrane protein [uncultured Desulfobacter sp.]
MLSISKRTIVLSIILFLFVLGGIFNTISAANKVGYINLDRLVKESNMGKAAMENINRLRKEKQAMINQKLQTINEIKINLESEADLLKDQEKKDRVEELNTLIKEYKRIVADAKEEIAKEDRELVAQILKKADGALKKVAKKNKFTMILKDPNAIGYLDKSVDITEDVLKELNK